MVHAAQPTHRMAWCLSALAFGLCAGVVSPSWAKSRSLGNADCTGLPGQAALMAGLRLAHQASTLPSGSASVNWIAVFNRKGEICAVSSNDRDAEAAGVAPNFDKGLPLYNAKGAFMGAIAVAGNGSACANHLLAWRARSAYYLDYVPSSYGASRVGPISWTGNLSPTACQATPGGLSAQADLPSTRRNPALQDQSQALRD